MRTLRRRPLRMGGGISRRRSPGIRYGLAALGFVAARAGDRTDLQEHEDLSGEQAQGAWRECDQFIAFGSLTRWSGGQRRLYGQTATRSNRPSGSLFCSPEFL